MDNRERIGLQYRLNAQQIAALPVGADDVVEDAAALAAGESIYQRVNGGGSGITRAGNKVSGGGVRQESHDDYGAWDKLFKHHGVRR